jgi:MoaA/NifB/PqqE/SkfB family radical SAM enzyme
LSSISDSGDVDVLAGHACNSRCRFCVQGDLREQVAPPEASAVAAQIDAARAVARGVVLTGGEVTLRPELPEWVRQARDAGFQSIWVQTNGRMLAYRGYAERLAQAGVTGVQVALHGHEAALHDYLTRARGGFDQAVLGIRRARAAGLPVRVTTVITRSSFRHLEATAALGARLGMAAWRVQPALPVGEAAREMARVVPRYGLLAPELARAIRKARSLRVQVTLKGMPLCVLPGLEALAADAGPGQRAHHLAMAGPHKDPETDVAPVWGPLCSGCRLRGVCPGVPARYAERYGWSELRPPD